MKPGFKPTLWTKKEWQDNRAPACKGCGVGEALDQLQPFRNKSIATMTPENLSKANSVLGKLTAALNKADGKCGPNQKDTKAGIGEYKKAVVEFEKKLKAAIEAHTKRATALKQFPYSLEDVFTRMGADADYKAALVEYSKADHTEKEFDAWFLFKQKKFTDMVRKYGPNNDYNLSAPVNEVLLDVFVSKKNLTPERIKMASQLLNNVKPSGFTSQGIDSSFFQMIGPGGVTGRFHQSEHYKKYVIKKVPIADSKM
jgi:hypothetical protein